MLRLFVGISLLAVMSGVPWAAEAANARHPYANVDRRVDAGNDTGDRQVDELNRAQLGGPYSQSGPGLSAPGYDGYAQPDQRRPAYPPPYPPPPGYAPAPYPSPGYPPPPGYYGR